MSVGGSNVASPGITAPMLRILSQPAPAHPLSPPRANLPACPRGKPHPFRSAARAGSPAHLSARERANYFQCGHDGATAAKYRRLPEAQTLIPTWQLRTG